MEIWCRHVNKNHITCHLMICHVMYEGAYKGISSIWN
jgi:hypothetical protein